jgi:hypothetical protein
MAATALSEQTGIRINGIGVELPGPGGPALATVDSWGVVLTVCDENGKPIASMPADAFSVSVLTHHRSGTVVYPESATTVTEPMPGVYVIGLHRHITDQIVGPFACVVDLKLGTEPAGHRVVRPAGSVRTLVSIGR